MQPQAGSNDVQIELKALAATVKLDTMPTGASVDADGKDLGATPLVLTALPPNTTVALTFKKTGYQDAIAKLDVPGPGKELSIVQPLAVASEFARVKLTSEPSGASVMQNGNLLAGVTTPAAILVEAGKPVRFTITMPRKVPALIDPFTPGRGADGIKRHVKLVDGVALHIRASIDGTVTVTNAPHCQALETPADCVLAKGTYTMVFTGAPNARVVKRVTIGEKEVTEHLDFGFVEAGAGKQIVGIPGGPTRRAAYEVGTHQVTVSDETGTHPVGVRVRQGATVVVN